MFLSISPHLLLLLLLSRFSCVQLCVTPYTAAHQAPPSLGILQARTLEWVAISASIKYNQVACRGLELTLVKPSPSKSKPPYRVYDYPLS